MSARKHPIKNLTGKLKKHEAFSLKNFNKISAFYLKLILQEPFRLLEKANFKNSIENHRLEKDPIFIVGHWRSGTSFLQYLMGKDPQFGFMNKFQVVFPDAFLHSEVILKKLVDKLPDSLNLTRDARNMSINLDLDSPSEIEIALTTMISPASLHWGHIFPQDGWDYFEKYLFLDSADEKEIEKWKSDYNHLIKKISLKNDSRQLLIKSPGNASRMTALLDLYPNAKFIFLYRNPYDVFYSSKKLWNTLLDNLALQEFSQQQMEEEIIRVYKKLMRYYLQQKSAVPDGHLVEIKFEEFVNKPLEKIENIYKVLDIGCFNRARDKMEEFLKTKTSGKSSSYEYEAPIIRTLNKEWKFAFEEWDYPLLEKEEPVLFKE